MDEEKLDIKLIPFGIYCYDEDGICPYWKRKIIEGTDIKCLYCEYLNEYDLGGLTDEEYVKLKEYLTENDIDKLYTLSLLWDQVKECGQNEY